MKIDPIPLNGGVDSVTTPILVTPGKLISATNFEPSIFGGYMRMAGIERFDGRARPSDAHYHVFTVTTSGEFSAGDTITGVTSSQTAVVIKVINSTQLIVTKRSGVFTAAEILNVSGSPEGAFVSSSENGADTSALHAEYKNLAADSYRNDINKPAGSGPIRGTREYNGEKYCFRDNVGATACVMFKATSSGWTPISFGREIQFTNAVGEIFEGDTVTGATSGATGVVKRTLLRTGTWISAGVGTLVFDSVTGTFQNGEALQVAAATKATSSTVDTAITLQPGGKFEFDNYNFAGTSATYRMYCADGVNFIGEFDGTRWVPIRTGISTDAPKYIRGQKNHLFAIFGSNVQFSSIGNPYSWTALTGASQIGLGEDGIGLLPQVGDASNGAMVISTATRIYILYGNDSSDFNLILYSPETGCKPYTLQNIGFAHFWNNKGLIQLQSSQAFGGFQMSIMTQAMQDFVDRQQGKEVASCIVRKKNQYRIFFNDGTGLIVYFQQSGNGMKASLMPFDYGEDMHINQVCSFIDTDGKERLLASGSDGYVYELDRGTSFDGNSIPSHIMMAYANSKSIRMRKRYKRTILHMSSGNTANIRVGYDLSYGSLEASSGENRIASIGSTGGFWDDFTWGSFFWDSVYLQEVNVDTPGNGESISIVVTGDTDEDEPYTIDACILHYLPGRMNR